jgi:hypothetical protein
MKSSRKKKEKPFTREQKPQDIKNLKLLNKRSMIKGSLMNDDYLSESISPGKSVYGNSPMKSIHASRGYE